MGVRVPLLLPSINKNTMNKVLFKKDIGDFFSKMYSAYQGRNIEVNLMLNDDKIQIYDRENFSFTDIALLEEDCIDELVKSIKE